MVLGRLFRKDSGEEQESQEEGQKAAPAVRVSAGGKEVDLEHGDYVVLGWDPDVAGREIPEGQAVFEYFPAPHKLKSGAAGTSLTPLGEAAQRGSRVSVAHRGDHLLVFGWDFRVRTGSGELHFEKTIQQVPLEKGASFAVEAAGHWATVETSGRGKAKALEAGVPATRFTLAAYRKVGRAVEKAAEVQLEPGDRAIVGRWSEELAEKYGVAPSPNNVAVPHILVVDSGGRVKHYAPLGVLADTTVSRTHLVLEVPREGGGLIVQDYGYRGQGSTNGTTLIPEGADGKPMRLVLQGESARFYPAPSKHLTVQLGSSVFLYIEPSR